MSQSTELSSKALQQQIWNSKKKSKKLKFILNFCFFFVQYTLQIKTTKSSHENLHHIIMDDLINQTSDIIIYLYVTKNKKS